MPPPVARSRVTIEMSYASRAGPAYRGCWIPAKGAAEVGNDEVVGKVNRPCDQTVCEAGMLVLLGLGLGLFLTFPPH